MTIDELLDGLGYAAVFVGTGAGSPKFMGIPGENLKGVYSANEYLTRVNLMRAYSFPDYDTPVKHPTKAVVIGAGDTAMDAVRVSIRLGAEEARIVYRRSEHEMGARAEDYRRASEEGAIFEWLTLPTRFLGDDDGRVRAVECLRTELGEPDESGRRSPVPIPGSEFVLEANLVVIALGTNPNPLVPQTTTGLEHRPPRLHRRRPRDRRDEPARRLRRRRHRHRRGDRDPRHGRRPPRGNRNPLLRAVESSERTSRWTTDTISADSTGASCRPRSARRRSSKTGSTRPRD